MAKKGPTSPTPSDQSDNRPMWKTLTIEPVIMIHMATMLLGFMAIQDVLLQKSCRVNFAYSDAVCDALESKDLESYPQEEQSIQKFLGPIIMWRMILINIFPVLLVYLVGAWSDKFGRKLPMLMVLFSMVVYHVFICICAQIQVGAWFVGLVSSLIISMGGSNAVFGMAVFSYVADTTSKEKLTQRTSITGSCYFFGITLGLGLRGILAAMSFTFAQTFGLAAILEGAAFLYLFFFIKNIRDEKAIAGISNGEQLREIFKLKHISDSLSTVFKKREGNDRFKLIVLLMCHALVMGPMLGETSIVYLFTRFKFNWDAGAFSAFMTYKTVVGFVGNFLCMAILTGKLKLSDPMVGIVSCASQLAASLTFGLGASPTAMYVGPIVALLAGSITAVARSLLFKLVPRQETGKLNSFIGSMESMTQLVVGPMYSLLYTSTFEFFPGAFYLMSGLFMIPPLVVYIWLHSQENNLKKE